MLKKNETDTVKNRSLANSNANLVILRVRKEDYPAYALWIMTSQSLEIRQRACVHSFRVSLKTQLLNGVGKHVSATPK